MKKRIIMVFALLAGMLVILGGPASATGDHDGPKVCYDKVLDKEAYDEVVTVKDAYDEVVTVKDAYDETVSDGWQRYSWTGGPRNGDSAPGFPSSDWQPNVKGDPHGIGSSGAYFVSHGKSGKGDWFYLEALTKTIHHDAETKTVHHEAVTDTVHHEATYKQVEVPCEVTPPVDDKYPYEVDVCWVMAASDGVEGTYEFPQTRTTNCTPTPKCEELIEIQNDTYWIRDKADEDYLAGLTNLNSPADDARLEPHGYFSKVFRGEEKCPVVVPPTEEPPVVVPPVVTPPEVVPPVTDTPEVPKPVDTPKDEGKIGTPTSEDISQPSASTDSSDQVLPDTGGFSKLLLVAAVIALLVGVALVVTGRRKKK
jgi:LPXTG-motif cell wall-anchored protein